MNIKEMVLEELGDFGLVEDEIPKPLFTPPNPAKAAQNMVKGAMKAAKASQESAGSTAGPEQDLATHDKRWHKQGYQGGPCSVRQKWKDKGFDVAKYDLATSGFKTPENYSYEGEEKEGPEEETEEKEEKVEEEQIEKKEEKPEGGESGGEPEEQPKTEPEEVQIGDATVKVDSEEGKKAAEALAQIAADPNNPELAEKAQEAAKTAEEEQLALTDKIPEGEITDEQYAEIKEKFPDNIAEFKETIKQMVVEAANEGRAIDPSSWGENTAEGRAFKEVVAELKEQGAKVSQEASEPPPEEPKAEKTEQAEEPPPGPEEGESATEAPKAETQKPGTWKDQKWTPEQLDILRKSAEKWGADMRALKKEGAFADALSNILGKVQHFDQVKKDFESTNDTASESRRSFRENNVSKILDKDEKKSWRNLTADQIGALLEDENVPVSVKASLEHIKMKLDNPYESGKSVEKALEDYRKLCDRYDLLGEERKAAGESPAPIVPEHPDTVTSTEKKDPEGQKIDLSDIPDLPMRNGKLNDPDKITNKLVTDLNEQLKDELAKLGIKIKPEDIKVKPLLATTEFSYSIPEGVSISEKRGNDIIQKALELRFPIDKPGSKDKKKAIFRFDPYSQTFNISVENDVRGLVSQKALLQSPEFQEAMRTGETPVLLGLDEDGKPIIEELNKLIHSIIIGMTDSGKSVFMTNIISSLLMQDPYNVQPMLVDMKGVDMPKFDGSKNLNFRTATTPDEVLDMMKWLSKEHELRLQLFKQAGVSNIKEYNEKSEAGKLPAGLPKHLPRLPLIVDEFTDLLEEGEAKSQSKEIMAEFNKFARKARATGINMFLATQKSTSDFIPTSITSQGASRFGLAMPKTEAQNAKKFGTPDAITIPAKSGGFQAVIGNDRIVKGQSGFLPEEGYSALFEKFKAAKGSPTASPDGNTTPTGGEGETVAKTPEQQAWLDKMTANLKDGTSYDYADGGKGLDMIKRELTRLGIPFDEKPLGNGQTRISVKKEETESTEGTAGAVSPSGTAETTETAGTSATAATAGTSSPTGTATPAEGTTPTGVGGGEGGTRGGEAGGAPSEGDSSAEGSAGGGVQQPEPIDPKDLEGLEKRDALRLKNAAKAFQDAGARLDAALEAGQDTSELDEQFNEALERYNEMRRSLNRPEVDQYGKIKSGETPAAEGSAPAQQGAEGENGAGQQDASQSETSKSIVESKDYDPSDYDSMVEWSEDVRTDALNDLDARTKLDPSDKNYVQKNSQKHMDERAKIESAYQKNLSRYKKQFADVLKAREAESAASKKQGTAKSEAAAITTKDDVSKLSPEEKYQYDGIMRQFNKAIAKAKADYDNDRLSLKKYREKINAAVESVNADRAELGFTNKIDASGTFVEQSPASTAETPAPEAKQPEPAKAETSATGAQPAETEEAAKPAESAEVAQPAAPAPTTAPQNEVAAPETPAPTAPAATSEKSATPSTSSQGTTEQQNVDNSASSGKQQTTKKDKKDKRKPKKNRLQATSTKSYDDASDSGSNGLYSRGLGLSLPIDHERTKPGGKVYLKTDDANWTDWINNLLDGYGGLTMSKGGKIRLGNKLGVPLELRKVFGNTFVEGNNDGLQATLADELRNEEFRDMSPEQIYDALQKDKSNYKEWREQENRRLNGETTESLSEKRQGEYYANQAEAEKANTVEVGGEPYLLDDLEEKSDKDFDEAYADVMKLEGDTETLQQFSPEAMKSLQYGDHIRFAGSPAEWQVLSYDPETNTLRMLLATPGFDTSGDVMVEYEVSPDGFVPVASKTKEGVKGNERQGQEGTAENIVGNAAREGDADKGTVQETAPGTSENFELISSTAEEINEEQKKRRQQAEIKRKQDAPIKGGGTRWQDTELGSQGSGGQMDLFTEQQGKQEEAPQETVKEPEDTNNAAPKTQAIESPLSGKTLETGPTASSSDPKEMLKSDLPPKEFADYVKALKEAVTIGNKITAKAVRDRDENLARQEILDIGNEAGRKAREEFFKVTKGWTPAQRVEANKKWFSDEKVGRISRDNLEKEFKEAAKKDPTIAALEKKVSEERQKKGGVHREEYKNATMKRREALDAFRAKYFNEKYFPGEENWGRSESETPTKPAQVEQQKPQESPSATASGATPSAEAPKAEVSEQEMALREEAKKDPALKELEQKTFEIFNSKGSDSKEFKDARAAYRKAFEKFMSDRMPKKESETPETKASEPKAKPSETKAEKPKANAEAPKTETMTPIEKAMKEDKGIQSLEKRLSNAVSKHGDDSAQAKKARQNLDRAKENFESAFEKSQREDAGVESDARAKEEKPKQETKKEPAKKEEENPQAKKEPEAKIEKPAEEPKVQKPTETEKKKEVEPKAEKVVEEKGEEPKKEAPAATKSVEPKTAEKAEEPAESAEETSEKLSKEGNETKFLDKLDAFEPFWSGQNSVSFKTGSNQDKWLKSYLDEIGDPFTETKNKDGTTTYSMPKDYGSSMAAEVSSAAAGWKVPEEEVEQLSKDNKELAKAYKAYNKVKETKSDDEDKMRSARISLRAAFETAKAEAETKEKQEPTEKKKRGRPRKSPEPLPELKVNKVPTIEFEELYKQEGEEDDAVENRIPEDKLSPEVTEKIRQVETLMQSAAKKAFPGKKLKDVPQEDRINFIRKFYLDNDLANLMIWLEGGQRERDAQREAQNKGKESEKPAKSEEKTTPKSEKPVGKTPVKKEGPKQEKKEDSKDSPPAKTEPEKKEGGSSTAEEYLKRKAEREAAEAAKKEAEAKARRERMAKVEAERKGGGGSRELNVGAPTSKGETKVESSKTEKSDKEETSPAYMTAFKGLVKPTEVNEESAQDLNKKLETINNELAKAVKTYYYGDEKGAIKAAREKISAIYGEFDRLLKERRLGAGNFRFQEMKDSGGHRTGLKITEYKDADGTYKKAKYGTPQKKSDSKGGSAQDEMPYVEDGVWYDISEDKYDSFGSTFTDEEWDELESEFVRIASGEE